MKNILVCSADFDYGVTGAFHFARFVLDINEMSDNYRIWLLTEDIVENAPQRKEILSGMMRKVDVKYPRFLYPFAHYFRNWAYYRAIRRFQKEQQVDAVFFNQALFSVAARWFLPKKIKIMGTIHDDHSLLPDRNSFPTFKNYLFYRYGQRPLEILAIHFMDVVLANSEYIKRLILEKRGVAPNRLVRLYQTVDVHKISFLPRNWQYKEESLIKILFVKAGYIRGGLEELICALGSMTKHPFELTVVGTTQDSTTIITSWVQPFSNISIQIRGILPPKEVSDLMYNHHVLCIPARKEALGLANIEGLAHGISVVSTRAGGIPEVLDNGNCGWLAEPNNPASLSAALQNCIECPPSERTQKSLYGRQFVEKHFSKEGMLNQIIDILDTYTP
jgi:colanic acid/amylovoran biosynthesis glycosyltransferase